MLSGKGLKEVKVSRQLWTPSTASRYAFSPVSFAMCKEQQQVWSAVQTMRNAHKDRNAQYSNDYNTLNATT